MQREQQCKDRSARGIPGPAAPKRAQQPEAHISSCQGTGDTLSFHRDRLVQAPRPEHLRKLVDILAALDRSIGPDAIDLPGCRLHAFSDTMKGYFVSPVSAKWRVTSRFEAVSAVDVDYVDYY